MPTAHSSHLEANKEHQVYPEGGPPAQAASQAREYTATLMVLGSFLLFFNIWGLPITFGAYQIFYETSLLKSYSPSVISWIGTSQGSLLILVGTVSGPLYDLGYLKTLLLAGSLFTVFGLMMLSLSTQYYQVFLSQALCIGIGSGLLYVPSLALVGTKFTSKRAVAMGITTSGGTLGGIVYTVVFQQLVPALGFAWTNRVMGFISLATFIIATAALVKAQDESKVGNHRRARSLFDRTALKDVSFLLFTMAQFLVFLAYLVPLFFIPTFAQTALGTSRSFAIWLLVIAQGTSLVGRVLGGFVAQWTGTMLSWTVCCAVSAILCLIWVAVQDLAGFIVFSALYGLATGALIALPPTIFPRFTSTDRLGTRMGMSWAATGIAYLIGSPIGLALIDLQKKNFLGVQVWSGVVFAVATLGPGALWWRLLSERSVSNSTRFI